MMQNNSQEVEKWLKVPNGTRKPWGFLHRGRSRNTKAMVTWPMSLGAEEHTFS